MAKISPALSRFRVRRQRKLSRGRMAVLLLAFLLSAKFRSRDIVRVSGSIVWQVQMTEIKGNGDAGRAWRVFTQ